jgi:hypothetical protein
MWLFDSSFEHNQLLAQHRIFNDQISTAPSHIGENATDKSGGNRLRPLLDRLFQSVAEIYARIKDGSNHTGIGSKWVSISPHDNRFERDSHKHAGGWVKLTDY